MIGKLKPADISVILHLKAKNDINGNPRRLFLVLGKQHQVLCAIDEGYEGESALRVLNKDMRSFPIAGIDLPIAAKEYRRLLKEYGFKK